MPAAVGVRINNITAFLAPALTLLDELDDALGPPFMQTIIETTQTLITGVQNAKRNRNKCLELVESIHQVLYPIIYLHLKSPTVGHLPLAVSENIGEFTESSRMGIGSNSSSAVLFNDCRTRLNRSIESFKSQTGVSSDVIQIQTEAVNMHKELLELISTLSDHTVSDRSSLVLYGMSHGSQKSSNSFALLPPKPKIFHGRESELKHVMELVAQDTPRIVILGGGGMGKTSLAKAALHHSETCTKFQVRFFVSAEAATTAVGLAALVSLHLGLEPGSNLSNPVVRYFAEQTSPCLLVLDDLETPWESLQACGEVEEFLSLLADVHHLALMITMRGSERPHKVRWTQPFLPPLEPLSDEAALQILEEITDDPHLTKEKRELLQFTGNMPLALDLIAHLVEYEDGLSDAELVESNLPIDNILSCKSVLIATSLAYKDTKGRLRSLVPIREHVRCFFPPAEILVESLRKSFHDLLALYQNCNDLRLSNILPRITANLANIEEVLHWGLQHNSFDLAETIQSTVSLNAFYRCHPQLKVLYIIECLRAFHSYLPINPEEFVSQGISQLQHFHDPILESTLYLEAGRPRLGQGAAREFQFLEKAYRISKFTKGGTHIQRDCLLLMGFMHWRIGNSTTALKLGREAVQLAYQTTDLYHVSKGLNVYLHRSDYTQAKRIQDTILQNSSFNPNSFPSLSLQLSRVQIDIASGMRKDLVQQDLDAVRKISVSTQYLPGITWCDLLSAELDMRDGNTASARAVFHNYVKLNLGKDIEVVTYCLEKLGDLTQWPPELHGQTQWPVVYLCQSHRSRDKLGFSNAFLFMTDLFIEDDITAHSLLSVALEGFTFMDVYWWRAQCMMRLGDLAQKKGETAAAAGLWKSARPLFERSLQVKDVACIDNRLATLEVENLRTQEQQMEHA
ncbi:hypothetical protein C8R46DRAFT_1028426 [Mycena filopes]|nr:hypothetical protein C8R46DRAFT_1028426 [Mycena filopes]